MRYTLGAQERDAAGNEPFAINVSTGVVSVGNPAGGAPLLDYEGKRGYRVLLTLLDVGG